MRRMNSYEWKVFNWFTEKVKTLDDAKEMSKKYFDTENVDVLNSDNVILIYEKENGS
jgi:hypothetical protein